jgi:murein DD-endopeptidase MepM/ murein hydrolase activator NlpD
VIALLAPAAGPAALASYGEDPDDLRKERDKVKSQIKRAQSEAHESSRAAARAQAALARSMSKLGGARAALGDARVQVQRAKAVDRRLRERLAGAEASLRAAEADVVAGQAALDAQHEVVKDLVVTLYQQGDASLVTLSGYVGAQSPSDLIRQGQYAQDASHKQTSIFDELTAAEVLLRVRENEVQAARDEVAQRRADAAAILAEMQRLKERQKKAKSKVEKRVATNKVVRAKARQALRADQRMLRQLKREEARVRRELMAAIAAAAASAGGYTGNADGYLDYPVAGPVTSGYGYRVHPIYGYYGLHDGVDFGAGCGAPLRAVARGTVVSAYYSSVYGNRLYVNLGTVNGRNLIAVYNHASSYRVRVGARVARGDVVGYVGSTGWSTGCHLHFTVLRDGDPVDPMTYM